MTIKSRIIGAAVGVVLAAGLGSAGVALAQEATNDPTTTNPPAANAQPAASGQPGRHRCHDRDGGGDGGAPVPAPAPVTGSTSSPQV